MKTKRVKTMINQNIAIKKGLQFTGIADWNNGIRFTIVKQFDGKFWRCSANKEYQKQLDDNGVFYAFPEQYITECIENEINSIVIDERLEFVCVGEDEGMEYIVHNQLTSNIWDCRDRHGLHFPFTEEYIKRCIWDKTLRKNLVFIADLLFAQYHDNWYCISGDWDSFDGDVKQHLFSPSEITRCLENPPKIYIGLEFVSAPYMGCDGATMEVIQYSEENNTWDCQDALNDFICPYEEYMILDSLNTP
jgi:hypothetical protein